MLVAFVRVFIDCIFIHLQKAAAVETSADVGLLETIILHRYGIVFDLSDIMSDFDRAKGKAVSTGIGGMGRPIALICVSSRTIAG
jgi:hypothetical protein